MINNGPSLSFFGSLSAIVTPKISNVCHLCSCYFLFFFPQTSFLLASFTKSNRIIASSPSSSPLFLFLPPLLLLPAAVLVDEEPLFRFNGEDVIVSSSSFFPLFLHCFLFLSHPCRCRGDDGGISLTPPLESLFLYVAQGLSKREHDSAPPSLLALFFLVRIGQPKEEFLQGCLLFFPFFSGASR